MPSTEHQFLPHLWWPRNAPDRYAEGKGACLSVCLCIWCISKSPQMWSNIDASEEENYEIIRSRNSKWCKQLTEVIRRLPPPQNRVLDERWCLGRCLDRHIATTWEAKGTDWGKPPEIAIAPSPLNPSILTTSTNSYCLCDPIVCRRLHHSVPQSISHGPPWCNLLRDSLMCKKWSQMIMMTNPEAHMSSGRRSGKPQTQKSFGRPVCAELLKSHWLQTSPTQKI